MKSSFLPAAKHPIDLQWPALSANRIKKRNFPIDSIIVPNLLVCWIQFENFQPLNWKFWCRTINSERVSMHFFPPITIFMAISSIREWRKKNGK
jgi:hypothetical protein